MLRLSKRQRYRFGIRRRKVSPRPRPGKPVRGSRTAGRSWRALDLLGRRWALRVLWELRDGPLSFRELRERCDQMSTSVLNQRLAELRMPGWWKARAATAHEMGAAAGALGRWTLGKALGPSGALGTPACATTSTRPGAQVDPRTSGVGGLLVPEVVDQALLVDRRVGNGLPPAQPGFTRKSRRFQIRAPLTNGFDANTSRWYLRKSAWNS